MHSNGKREHIETGLQRKGFEKYISAIATKEEVVNPKPAPDIYLLAAEKLGANIKNTVAVEDSRPGALGAAASGATLILQQTILLNTWISMVLIINTKM